MFYSLSPAPAVFLLSGLNSNCYSSVFSLLPFSLPKCQFHEFRNFCLGFTDCLASRAGSGT